MASTISSDLMGGRQVQAEGTGPRHPLNSSLSALSVGSRHLPFVLCLELLALQLCTPLIRILFLEGVCGWPWRSCEHASDLEISDCSLSSPSLQPFHPKFECSSISSRSRFVTHRLRFGPLAFRPPSHPINGASDESRLTA